MDTRLHVVRWGTGQPRHLTREDNRRAPHRWNRRHATFFAEHGRRQRVFSASLSDWLDNEVPIEWLAGLLETVRTTPNLDWLLLTKRVGNWRKRLEAARDSVHGSSPLYDWLDDWLGGAAPANVWLGITVVNQAEADRDIPKLLDLPARLRFLSLEPLLGPVDITSWLHQSYPNCPQGFEQGARMSAGYCGRCAGHRDDPIHTAPEQILDWVIAGGESGREARPTHIGWLRSVRDQCAAACVKFMFKQWGEWIDHDQPGVDMKGSTRSRLHDFGQRVVSVRLGRKETGRALDGRIHDEFPAVEIAAVEA